MEPKRLDIGLLKSLEEKQEVISFWIGEHRRALFIGGSLLLVLTALLFTLLFKQTEDWGKSRAEVEKGLQKMERFEVAEDEALLEMAQSIEGRFKSSTEFPSFYQGRLAQALIQNGHPFEAERLLKEQASRLSLSLPLPFQLFSESSLLIAKGEYQKAWEVEEALQKELQILADAQGDERWSSTLTAFNLVRRALLADLLEKEKEAAILKEEIFSLLKEKNNDGRREALEGIVEAYRVGQKTLLSYLEKEKSFSPHLASEGKGDL